MSRLDTIPKLP